MILGFKEVRGNSRICMVVKFFLKSRRCFEKVVLKRSFLFVIIVGWLV